MAEKSSATKWFGPAFLAGAVAMYLFDPKQGKSRRRTLKEKSSGTVRRVGKSAARAGRDFAHRTQGAFAHAKHFVQSGATSDEVLVERARSLMGHLVSRPTAIEIVAQDGCLTLQGIISPQEEPEFVHRLSKLPGVKEIDNQLGVDPQSFIDEKASAIPVSESLTPSYRYGLGLAGASLLFAALRAPRVLRFPVALIAAAVGASALANRPLRRLLAGRVSTRKSIHVDLPVEDVYQIWNHPEGFPLFLEHVREVETEGNLSYWIVDGPAGFPVTWVAETTRNIPNEIIEWKTVPDSFIEAAGRVKFRDEGELGTRIDVELEYRPPGGPLGHGVARLWGVDPKTQITADLNQLRTNLG